MVLVSHRYKFIFIKVNRTASTTIESFLQKFCLSKEEEENYKSIEFNETIINEHGIISTRDPKKNNKGLRGHISLEELKSKFKNNFKDYKVITSIRNPFDMAVSSHEVNKAISKKSISFSTGLKFFTDRKQIYNIALKADFVIRYEYLKEDLNKLLIYLNINNKEINLIHSYNVHNQIKRPDIIYKKYYNDESKRIVYENFKDIINKFNYEF